MCSVGTNGLTVLSATDRVKGSLKLLGGGITQFYFWSLMGFIDVKLKFLHLLKWSSFLCLYGEKKEGKFCTLIKSYMAAL